MAEIDHPVLRDTRTGRHPADAEQHALARQVYQSMEHDWFTGLRNPEMQNLQKILPHLQVDDYSTLAKENDVDRQRLAAAIRQNATMQAAQPADHGKVPADGPPAAAAQPPADAQQNANPVQHQIDQLNNQLVTVENDFYQLDKGQNGKYTYDQIHTIANDQSNPAHQAAQALLGLIKVNKNVIGLTSYTSDFANSDGSMSADSITTGVQKQSARIATATNFYNQLDIDFHTLAPNQAQPQLFQKDLGGVGVHSDDPNEKKAAGDLIKY